MKRLRPDHFTKKQPITYEYKVKINGSGNETSWKKRSDDKINHERDLTVEQKG